MYKLDLPLDYKETAAIERRRNMEAQRQSRIFNAKVRTIGIDLNAVNQQVVDRNQQTEYEKRRHEAFAHDMVRTDKITQMLQKRQEHDVHELNKAVNEFRLFHQQPEGRREWDLYDPDGKKKDKPARVSDDDPRCGIASIQKFDGEDLNNKARTKFQQEQNREWALQQQREKQLAKDNQNKSDRLYDLKMRELDQRGLELQKAEDECKRAINVAQKDYNQALASEMSDKERLRKQQELDDNMTEIANHIYGDILTENPSVAQSAWGAHRVITDRWKGMSPKEIEEIQRTQEIQRKENERRKQEEEIRNKEWDRQRVANARAAELIEREQDRLKRDIKRQQAEENRRLAQEQGDRKEFMDKEVYTNPPTGAYFMQFNTSSR